MKKTEVFVAWVLLLLTLTACAKETYRVPKITREPVASVLRARGIVPQYFNLSVNGEQVGPRECICRDGENQIVIFPLLAVMEALGAEITQVSEEELRILYCGKIYFLFPGKNYLAQKGKEDFNLLMVAAGNDVKPILLWKRGEYFVSDNMLNDFFWDAGITTSKSSKTILIEGHQSDAD